MVLTARISRLGFLLVLLAMLFGAASSARAATVMCSDFWEGGVQGVVDGYDPATYAAIASASTFGIDMNCVVKNFPQSIGGFPITNINFYFPGGANYYIAFLDVYYYGNMSCNDPTNSNFWIYWAPGGFNRISSSCQEFMVPVDAVLKKNPPGQTTAITGVPFTYTITAPLLAMLDSTGTYNYIANSDNADIKNVVITDDLTLSDAAISYISNTAYMVDPSGGRTSLGSLSLGASSDWLANHPGVLSDEPPTDPIRHLVFSYEKNPVLANIPAGYNIEIELTVVLDPNPPSVNPPGTIFSNTARMWFDKTINATDIVDLQAQFGTTPPMGIVAPNLVVSKTSNETAPNFGVWVTYTIDVENRGGSDAWNATILDNLPNGATGGMCDYDPTAAPDGVIAQIFAADGVTPVSDPLVLGTDYSFSYSGAPTCQLSFTMLTDKGKIAPDQHLIITYQNQLDVGTQNGIQLTNVAGATKWFGADSSYIGRREYDRTLTDGTPGVDDFQDSQTVTSALSGYYFQKTVEDLTSHVSQAVTASPGDRLRYKLRLFNIDQDINEITISDQLDTDSFDLATFTMVTPPPAGATYSFNSVNGLLTISGGSDPLNVAIGGELVIEFDITLKSTLTNGTLVSNQANLFSVSLPRTEPSDDPYVNGIAMPLVQGDEDPTVLTILTPGPVSKANTQANATIGEQFKYRITVPATPIDVPLYDVRILDDLSASAADLRFVSVVKVSGSGSWAPVNSGSDTDLIIEDTNIGIDILANDQAVIEITVELLNTSTNQSGLLFDNSASYTYNRMNGDTATQANGGQGSTTTMTVVEPDLTATKVASNVTPGKLAGAPITGGDIIQYVVTINNSGSSTAYDVNVVDTLPSALTFYSDSGFVPTATINLTPVSGFVATPTGASGGPLVWGRNNGDDNLDIPAGGSLVLTYHAQVLESTVVTFSNLVWVDWTSLDNASAYERTGAGCPTTTAPNDYCYGPISVTTTTTDNNSLTKAIIADTYVDASSTASDKVVRIGDIATYSLTLNLGEGTTRSVKVQDVLPGGMAYDSLVSITPASGSSTFTYSVVSEPAAGATGTLVWDLGDVVNAPSNGGTDALVIEYKAKVLRDAGIAHVPSTTLTNTATLSYQDAGGNAVIDPTRLVASDTLTVRQPVLSVNKTATPAGGDNIIEAAEVVTYTVDIINSGAGPAYDTVLVDTLPLGMRQGGVTTTSVTLVTAGTALPVLAPVYDANTGTATWNFDNGTANAYTIPAGETLRVVYQVTADADLGAGLILTNAVTATLYYSFDDEEVPTSGLVTDRQVYGPTNTATTNLTTPTPGALLKENTQPTAAIGEQFKYTITVPAIPQPTALHDVRIIDDLSASAADLRFVSVAKVSGSGSWTPVNTGTGTVLVIEDTNNGIEIPANEQVVVEVTVELLNTSTNVVGLSFTNTADYTYNQIDNTPTSRTNGLPDTTAPMQIVGMNAQKTVSIAVDGDNNSNGLVDPGDELIYTIVVKNPGPAPVTGVVLTDDVPANTTYVTDSVTLNGVPVGRPDSGISPLASGVAINSAGSVSGTIAARSSAVITFMVQVNAGVPAGTVISNQGYVTSNELPIEPTDADGNPANGYQPTTIVVGSAQQVMITKEVSVVGGGAALPGSELEYVVRVTNTGSTPITNLVITDDLDGNDQTSLAGQATYVAGSATLNGTTSGVSYADSVLTADYAATYGNLPTPTPTDDTANTATLRFRVLIANGLVSGTRLTNTAQMEWNTPTLTATASVSIDIGGVIGSAILNGQVWHDADFNKLYDAGETNMAGWTVGLFRNNVQVDSVTTDANGLYSFIGLEPTLTTAGQYELRFTAPGAGLNTASLGNADSSLGMPTPRFIDGPQRISGITVASGDNLQGLNLPITPNGVVYNSDEDERTYEHTPVAGVTVTMVRASAGGVFSALPASCFDDPAQQNQVTHVWLVDKKPVGGFYKFDLKFDPVNCPAGADYLIAVTAVPAGYMMGPSLVIKPMTSDQTAPYSVPTCSSDAIPDTTQCEAQVSMTAPTGAATTYYLHITLNEELDAMGNQIYNQIYNNHIPVDPYVEEKISITKTSPLINVTRGQLVPYTITFKNTLRNTLPPLGVVDTLPPGFKYVKGSGRLDDTPLEPDDVNGRRLAWNDLDVGYNKKHAIKLLLVAGAGVSEGEYVNRAQVIDTQTGGPFSEVATATVRIIPDPDFDCADVIGKVFDDTNLNGQQDPGERGLPGVRVVTVRGLISTSDKHGRFHITCAVVPDEDRGSNFILKLDERSLPTGYRLTTENPRVQRATRGKMIRFNFGATIHRVVRIDISDGAFEPGTTELRIQWAPRIAQLLEELKKAPSVLRLSYLVDVERNGLVQERLKALKKEITKHWEQSDGVYRLDIETEIFWRRGAPLAGQ